MEPLTRRHQGRKLSGGHFLRKNCSVLSSVAGSEVSRNTLMVSMRTLSWPESPPWAIYQSTSDNWQHRSGCRVGWGSATAHSQTRHHTELAFSKHTRSWGHSPASCWRLTPGDHREQREVFPGQGEMTNGKVVLIGRMRQGREWPL